MTLLTTRTAYKPFGYPWAYEAWLQQQRIHWLPEEVALGDDIKDWKFNLTAEEKSLVTQIFRFFTQADIEVGNCYMKHYTNVFKPTEIIMMLTAFANMETIHIAAYSYLLDTIGMPETEYSAFLQYEEMCKKRDYIAEFEAPNNSDDELANKKHIAKTMAIFGAFTEGMQLFSSFAILLNFQRFNKLKGIAQIVAWSVRDETLHMQSIIKLFHTFISENPELWTKEFRAEILEACKHMVQLEEKFIDLAFAQGEVQGLTVDEVKRYIKFIADRRLVQLGLEAHYSIDTTSPLPWLDQYLNGVEHTNFFENRVTEYTRAATVGAWEDVSYE